MLNALSLMGALLSLGSSSGQEPRRNVLPEPNASPGKRRRKVDHLRIRAKRLHHGYPGAKLARKAFLGEVGTLRPN